MPLRVGVIVEGHGEGAAAPLLLRRIWYDLLKGDYIDVLGPFRRSQGQLLKEEWLKKTVETAQIKLRANLPEGTRTLVLILIDAETLCPRDLAPRLLGWAREACSDADIACVLPNPMFETWFAAAAASLAGVNGLPDNLPVPADPEGNRIGKTWIRSHLPRKYGETVDQPSFAAKIDLVTCRENSASFDKLCRELAARL